MKEKSLDQNRNLISIILTYPIKAHQILADHPELLSLDLIHKIEKEATLMIANGSQEAANFLQNLATELKKDLALSEQINQFPGESQSLLIQTKSSNKLRIFGSGVLFLLLLTSSFLTFTEPGKKWLLALSSNLSERLDRINQTSQTSQESQPEVILKNILPVETTKVELIDSYQVSRTYTGFLNARRSSELGFERAGKLVSFQVDEGDIVQTGMELASLDTRNLLAQKQELQAKIAQAKIKLKQMKAGPRSQTIMAAKATVEDLNQQLKLARKKGNRRESLYAQGAITREQMEESSSETSILQARLKKAQSELAELRAGTRSESIEAQKALIEQLNANFANLEIELDKSAIKAPFDGTISVRKVDEGTVITPSQPVIRLVENTNLEARIEVPVTVAEQLPIGSNQQIQIEQQTYSATVESILPELDPKSLTVTAILILDSSVATEIAPGQITKLNLTATVPTSGYWLPTNALVQNSRGLWSCYVLGQAEKSLSSESKNIYRVQRRDVEVLETKSDRVLVRGTLQPKDLVITNGTHRLVQDQLVMSNN